MKKDIVIALAVAAALLFQTGRLCAQQTNQSDIPRTISYQGVLIQDSIPVNGVQPITVSIYADAGGTNRIWSQAFKANVTNGIFNLTLGTVENPLPPSNQLDRSLWLGVKVAGDQFQSLSPLSTSLYALNVSDSAITTKKLASNAVTTDKIADGSVTWNKMGTDYIPYLSVNGAKVSTGHNPINFTGSEGMMVDFDSTTMSLNFHPASASSSGIGGKSGGNHTLSFPDWNSTGNSSGLPAIAILGSTQTSPTADVQIWSANTERIDLPTSGGIILNDAVAIPSFGTAGVVHNYAGGGLSSSLVALGLDVVGTLEVGNGGTGLYSTPIDGQLLIGSTGYGGYQLNTLTAGTGISITNGSSSITINSTGATSFSAGTTGLTPSSAATGAIVLGGTLNIANGGTGQTTANAAFNALSPMTTLGDIEYENSTPVAIRLAGTTSATKHFLTQTGTGSVSAAPAWGTIAASDLPAGSGNYIQNQDAAAQTSANFWIDGNGEMNGNATIGGTLNVGSGNTVSGSYSAAIGQGNAAATWAFASGYGNTAGDLSTALGQSDEASGAASFATGYNNTASGNKSVAMGVENTASGDFSTAMGRNANTNTHSYSFCYSDGSTYPYTTDNDADMQFMVRASGGYKLYAQSGSTVDMALTSSGMTLANPLAVTSGGTGLNVCAIGDMLYGSATNTLSTLGIGSTNHILTISGGVPIWGSVSYPNSCSTGDILYGSATNTLSTLSVGASNKVLMSTGSAPAWGSLIAGTGISLTPASGSITVATAAKAFFNTAVFGLSTSSTTSIMLGLGAGAPPATITPVVTGNILIIISGTMKNNTGNKGAQAQIVTGTGTAPAFGVAAPATGIFAGDEATMLIETTSTGTFCGCTVSTQEEVPFTCVTVLTAQTLGTPIWIDLAFNAIGASTASINDGLSIQAFEF